MGVYRICKWGVRNFMVLMFMGSNEGREEGVQSQILKKNRSKYFFLNKIMTNS